MSLIKFVDIDGCRYEFRRDPITENGKVVGETFHLTSTVGATLNIYHSMGSVGDERLDLIRDALVAGATLNIYRSVGDERLDLIEDALIASILSSRKKES